MDPIMQAIMQAMMAGGDSGAPASSFSMGNILKNLKKKPGDEEVDLKSFVKHPGIERGGFAGRASQYDPSRIYGGLYSLYGGRRVRGGLLGE